MTLVVNLRPNVDLHNGNRCSDDEEDFLGLCYKKCDYFAEGKYPFRISAWQCCNHQPPCRFGDYIMTQGQPCSGFGVLGDSMGNGCPHSPGGCFKDEELFGDICYLAAVSLPMGSCPTALLQWHAATHLALLPCSRLVATRIAGMMLVVALVAGRALVRSPCQTHLIHHCPYSWNEMVAGDAQFHCCWVCMANAAIVNATACCAVAVAFAAVACSLLWLLLLMVLRSCSGRAVSRKGRLLYRMIMPTSNMGRCCSAFSCAVSPLRGDCFVANFCVDGTA